MTAPLNNLLIESLPSSEKAALLPMLEAVPLPLGTVLHEAGESPGHIHFLTSGIASVVTTMEDGDLVEVGLDGREGVAGTVYLLGPQIARTRCMMQMAGTGLRVGFERFQQEFEANATLRRLILRHVQYQTLVLGQLSACNRLHEADERLARWLLMVADRTGDTTLALTQEFLGEMIGARRSTVTHVAGTLQRGGMIEYGWGKIRILDRESLEDTACECYKVIRRLHSSLYK